MVPGMKWMALGIQEIPVQKIKVDEGMDSGANIT
jgi:hypothetical protein